MLRRSEAVRSAPHGRAVVEWQNVMAWCLSLADNRVTLAELYQVRQDTHGAMQVVAQIKRVILRGYKVRLHYFTGDFRSKNPVYSTRTLSRPLKKGGGDAAESVVLFIDLSVALRHVHRRHCYSRYGHLPSHARRVFLGASAPLSCPGDGRRDGV